MSRIDSRIPKTHRAPRGPIATVPMWEVYRPDIMLVDGTDWPVIVGDATIHYILESGSGFGIIVPEGGVMFTVRDGDIVDVMSGPDSGDILDNVGSPGIYVASLSADRLTATVVAVDASDGPCVNQAEKNMSIPVDSCWQIDNNGDMMPSETPAASSQWDTDENGALQPI